MGVMRRGELFDLMLQESPRRQAPADCQRRLGLRIKVAQLPHDTGIRRRCWLGSGLWQGEPLLGILRLSGGIVAWLRSCGRLASIRWTRGIFPLRSAGCCVHIEPKFCETRERDLAAGKDLPLIVLSTPVCLPTLRNHWGWSSRSCHSYQMKVIKL